MSEKMTQNSFCFNNLYLNVVFFPIKAAHGQVLDADENISGRSFFWPGKHIILYLERVSPGFACFGNNKFSRI